MKFVVATVITAGLLLSTAACSAQPSSYSNTGTSSDTSQSGDSAPNDVSTPTPDPILPDASVQPPTSEEQALIAAGYEVVIVDRTGAPVADPSGYNFVSQSPTAGLPLALGSTVTLTVAAPPPPPPAPVVSAPAPATTSGGPGGATAQCKDGSLSFSQHRQGTCSHHAGVAIWY